MVMHYGGSISMPVNLKRISIFDDILKSVLQWVGLSTRVGFLEWDQSCMIKVTILSTYIIKVRICKETI